MKIKDAVCPCCGASFKKRRPASKFCTLRCARLYLWNTKEYREKSISGMMRAHPPAVMRRVNSGNGYVYIYVKSHPKQVGGYVAEHVVVAEKKIGRPLIKGEQVHHIDGNRLNNCQSNLEVVLISEHASHHAKLNWEKARKHGLKSLKGISKL